MLNEVGGFESDLTVLRLTDEGYRLFVGTGAIKRDLAWLRRHLQENERVAITDETADYAVLGLMGPGAAESAVALGGEALAGIGASLADQTIQACSAESATIDGSG